MGSRVGARVGGHRQCFQSPGTLCSVPGPTHRNRNTDYLFMERPLRAGWQRSGFTAGSRSGRAAASLAALPPAPRIPSGSSPSIGALCSAAFGFVVLVGIFLFFYFFSLGLLELLESSPLEHAGCIPPDLCGTGMRVRVRVPANIDGFVFTPQGIHAPVLEGEFCWGII